MFYVRHFIIGIAFFLILFSFVLAGLWQRGLPGKATCVLLLLSYFAANGWHMASLFKYGRGQSCEAIRFLKDRSNQWPVTIGSDHDFRIGLVLQFYGPTTLGQARYYTQGSWPQQGPEWVLCHKESFEAPTPATRQLKDGAGNEYEFVKAFPTRRCRACTGSSITTRQDERRPAKAGAIAFGPESV